MKQFTDTKGRTWDLTVDVAAIETVRDAAKVDLYNLFGEETKRVFADPVLLVDTLWVLCRPQAEARKMSDEDFGRSFDGDVLEAAGNALLEEVLNFFPSSRRGILRATVDKSAQLAAEMQDTVIGRINKLKLKDLLKSTASAE